MHLTWREVQAMANDAQAQESRTSAKLWLKQFCIHLDDYVTTSTTNDNTVYVVSLSRNKMRSRGSYTFIDVVTDGKYFHPVGLTWPTEPPNYVGFRYAGKLQSVHHIDSWEVVRNLASVDRRWPSTDSEHFVYSLGPAIKPQTEVRTGNIFRNARVRAALDLLISGQCATIREAADLTKERLALD